MPRAREIKILEPRQDSNPWPPKSLYSVSNGETLSAKLIFWSQESPNLIYRALNLPSAHAPPISKAICSPSLIYSVVYMTLSWKPQWSKQQDTEKPKVRMYSGIHWYIFIRCVYHIVKKGQSHIDFHSFATLIYHLSLISCHVNFFGEKPFFGLVSVNKVKCNG